MGIISSIKDLLGIEERDRGRSGDVGTTVAVERDTATETEGAVTGGSTGPAGGTGPATGSTTPEPEPAEPEPAAEPATPGTEAGGAGEPVDDIKGIGSAYADRLAGAGVNTVEDLADADPAALAADTDLGEGRISTWIEQARARTR